MACAALTKQNGVDDKLRVYVGERMERLVVGGVPRAVRTGRREASCLVHVARHPAPPRSSILLDHHLLRIEENSVLVTCCCGGTRRTRWPLLRAR